MTSRQRLEPTAHQVNEGKSLLAQVPVQPVYVWNSPAGHHFLAYVEQANQAGVPIAWLADRLGLQVGQLHLAMARYRSRSVA